MHTIVFLVCLQLQGRDVQPNNLYSKKLHLLIEAFSDSKEVKTQHVLLHLRYHDHLCNFDQHVHAIEQMDPECVNYTEFPSAAFDRVLCIC